MAPVVSFWMYSVTASSAVFSSQQYISPARQVQEAVGENLCHQSTAACLRFVVGRVLHLKELQPGDSEWHTQDITHYTPVFNTLEIFSTVRLWSGENRKKKQVNNANCRFQIRIRNEW